MKCYHSKFIILCFVSLVLIFQPPVFAETTFVKVASVMPEGSPWTNILRRMAADVAEETGGEVKLKIYAGGISGDESDVIRKMSVDRIHAAGFTGVGLGVIQPQIRILEAPLLFRSLEEIDFVKEKLFNEFAAEFDKKGYVFLGYIDGGFVYFFSQKDISRPGSLENTKMWLWTGDKVAATFLSSFDIRAFPLHVADVNTGLETGMIDSFYSVPVAAVSFQWYWRIKYMLDYPMVNSTGGFLISKNMFYKLSEKNQNIIKKLTKKYCGELVKITRGSNEEARNVLTDAGVAFVSPAPEQITSFESNAAKVYERSIPSVYSKEIFKTINEMLTDYRNTHSAAAGRIHAAN
jgi:TRAP-type C4-dicarboxylate transport system substrate-binding protein